MRADPQNKKIFIDIENATKRVRKALHSAFIEMGRENVKHTRQLIKNPNKTGRFYGRHQASAPGEAPANWTGALARSIHYKVSGWSQMRFGDKVLYGKFLEHGTRNSDGTERMKPRPHLSATVTDKFKDNYNSIQKHIDKATKK